MYLVLLGALLGSVASSTIPVVEPRNEDLAAMYNLPRETTPTFYDVTLYLDPDNEEYFYGNVSIRIVPNIATNVIVLHAMEMSIENIEVLTTTNNIINTNNNIYLSHELATDDTHLLRIHLAETLIESRIYILNINYVGQYATNMFGIYVSNYVENGIQQKLITSQLQPTFARRAFPCYDEPAIKAVFKTTIVSPASYTVVRTNMPEINNSTDPDGWVRHEFQDTEIMSTYLLAYLVSNFEHVSNEENPIYRVPFKVFSRPGTKENAEFAMDFGQKNMVKLEEYTEFDYVFPKLDKVAVPDFAAGAMENWGLVVYREVALLVTEGVTTTATRQNIGRIICHENMHMWFGNEVSPYSWTYTWLNEGFANFFENFATDLVLPEWRMMDQFVINMQNVFQSDAVISINPMTHPVFTPSQILGTFNAVAYQKSGSVIRMIQHFMTPELFRQGLVHYIKNMHRKAAQPADLYRSLQHVLQNSNHSIPFSIESILTRWTTQGGFPVLNVTRSSAAANSLVFQQERYLTDRSLSSPDRWHVPINVVLNDNPDFSDTKPDGWVSVSITATSIDVPGLSGAEWYIVNKQQTGYYRVNYDEANWRALTQVLANNHNVIHVLNRAQIIDDSFNLARNGRLSYAHPFQIATYLVNEEDYIPWASANAAISYLDVVLSGTEVYELFQRFILELTAPSYERLTFNPSPSEEHVTPYYRNIILDLNCRYGNGHCVNTSMQLLQQVQTGSTLNPDIQTLVYCSGLRGGNAANFDFLWGLYTETTDSSAQAILLNALGCTSNEEKRTFYLRQMIDENSLVREQDRHTIAVATINSGPENMEYALDFIIENFPSIQPNVQGLTGTTNILNALARRLTTTSHLQKINAFATSHANIFTAGELASIAAIRENIAASVSWNDQNLNNVESWINDYYYTGSASAMTASIVVLLSFFVTLFNQL
uniref:Aminopeptidase n=1 Tax=Diatraea saccharalis TaxID=40085 RepID=E0A210_9NEOP|nr:aminopeptidase N2 [Diatraea saccharalis]